MICVVVVSVYVHHDICLSNDTAVGLAVRWTPRQLSGFFK